MPKTIICRCEDITERDVNNAIDDGYLDLESLKRYLGFSTGPCQGKNCLRDVVNILIERTKADPASIHPITARPPISPAPLKYFNTGAKK